MKLTILKLTALAVNAALATQYANAQSIGINFTGSSAFLLPTDQPGIVAGANWNNFSGGSQTNAALHDSTGQALSTLLSYTSTRESTGYGTTSTPNAATNELYRGNITGNNIAGEVSVSLTNIPYASYDAYVYASQAYTANTLSITDGATTFYYRGDGQPLDGATSLTQTTSTDLNNPTVGRANYQIFPGLRSSSFSVTTGGSLNGIVSNNVFGLQIVPTPLTPRLFSLSIGASDGQGVRGDLDAQRVQSVLSQHPTFASASLGNPSTALSLTDATPNVQLQIETALDSMQIRSTDTFVFYFSGHGGTLPTFSLGDAPETPVTLDGQPNTDDEYLAAGSFNLTDDYLAALFDDPKWDGVRKIFLLDACFSGGFLGDGLTGDLGDLEQLDNFALFAAADEDALSYSVPLSGRGIWTEFALLPTLRARVGFAELQDAIEDAGQSILDTFGGDDLFLRGINAPGSTGTLSAFSPFSVASADFSGSDPLLPEPVPEPTSVALLFCGAAILARRRTLRTHERSA